MPKLEDLLRLTPQIDLAAMLALLFLVIGCQLSAPDATPRRLEDIAIGRPPPARLSLAVRDDPTYSAQFVRVLDWETAEVRLENASPATDVTKTATAAVDASQVRTANFTFANLTPAAAYKLTVQLKRQDPTGSAVTIASGTASNLLIGPGPNAVSVPLALTASGELVLSAVIHPVAPDPAGGTPSPLPTLATDVRTRSDFAIQCVAGSTASGNALGGDPLTASFKEISGLDISPAGDLYIAEPLSHSIRLVPVAGGSTVIAGQLNTPGNGGSGIPATTCQLNRPRGLVRDPVSGRLLFCDSANGKVRLLDGTTITTFAGSTTSTDVADIVGQASTVDLLEPAGLAIDETGNVFVSDSGNGKIRRIDAADTLTTTIATITAGASAPLAIDRTNDVLWAGDGASVKAIRNIVAAGANGAAVATVFTATGTPTPSVVAMAYDQLGSLYVVVAATAVGGSPNGADVYVYRMAVTSTGALVAGSTPEIVAGKAGSSIVHTDYDVPATSSATATTRLLTGQSWCALALDLSRASDSQNVAGKLYLGNSHASAVWGEVLRLTPSDLY